MPADEAEHENRHEDDHATDDEDPRRWVRHPRGDF